jgi:hypothetical protein
MDWVLKQFIKTTTCRCCVLFDEIANIKTSNKHHFQKQTDSFTTFLIYSIYILHKITFQWFKNCCSRGQWTHEYFHSMIKTTSSEMESQLNSSSLYGWLIHIPTKYFSFGIGIFRGSNDKLPVLDCHHSPHISYAPGKFVNCLWPVYIISCILQDLTWTQYLRS